MDGYLAEVPVDRVEVLRRLRLADHRDRQAGLSLGKTCIRYRRPDQVDLAVVMSMLAQTATPAPRPLP